MRKSMSLLAGLLLMTAAGLAQQAQPTIVAEGGALDERASARVLYWNTKADTHSYFSLRFPLSLLE